MPGRGRNPHVDSPVAGCKGERIAIAFGSLMVSGRNGMGMRCNGSRIGFSMNQSVLFILLHLVRGNDARNQIKFT